METILSVLENIKGYLPLIRLADLLDVAIVAYLAVEAAVAGEEYTGRQHP